MHQRATELQALLELGVPPRQQPTYQRDLEETVDKLNGYVEELHGVGAEVKDFGTGLIDFIGRHQGRDVCLCWKLGEETVGFWHEMQSGFTGRQPVSTLVEGD